MRGAEAPLIIYHSNLNFYQRMEQTADGIYLSL